MSDKTQQALREAGIVSFILETLVTCKDHPEIIKKAMIAICALAQNHETLNDLIQAGTCELVIDTSCEHLENEEVFHQFVLTYLAFSETPEGLSRFSNKMRSTLTVDEMSDVVEQMNNIAEMDV